MVMSARQRSNRSAGFTLVELLVVAGVVAVGASMAIVQVDSALSNFRGNSAMRTVIGQLNRARTLAMTQRRNMTMQFVPPNQIQIVRQEIPNGTTVVSTTIMEHSAQFHMFSGVPDTPDVFGNAADCDFGAATTTMSFTPEGALVNQVGVPVNGTVYVGRPTDLKTIRAVTVFGSTGRIRGYRWNGVRWELP
jgi:prepilin-type N-terminal cleavage/methylation domain-containing protein